MNKMGSATISITVQQNITEAQLQSAVNAIKTAMAAAGIVGSVTGNYQSSTL